MSLWSKLFKDEKQNLSADVEKRCSVVLKDIHEARIEIERGVTPEDKILTCQPIVSSLNQTCGRDGAERFKPVEIGLLLQSLARLQRAGVLAEVVSLSQGKVEQAILQSCGLLFVQTADVTEQTRGSIKKVAKALDELVSALNRAANVN